MQWLAILLGVIALSSNPIWAQQKSTRPNVLFIAIDDLNDWIGAMAGHSQTLTPNLDRLAKRGVLFTRAYCAAPACNPSRAALMTGILPSTSGIYHNPNPWRAALPKAVTIPQHFMAEGYWAGGSGKIYHGSYPDPSSWNEFFPSKTQQRPNDPLPPNRPIAGVSKSHFDWGPVDVPDQQMGDTQVADWVIKQLKRSRDKPFFLACGFYRPHLPWYVPRKYFDKFPADKIVLPQVPDNDLDDIPPIGLKIARPGGDHKNVTEAGQWQTAVQGYLASINFTDTHLGRVIDALDASPHAGNTIIVLWTDHGWHLGEKKHWRKFSLWEEATRTPVMFVVPKSTSGLQAGTAAGVRCERPVGLIDLYPTLVELCGLKPNSRLQGQSFVPLLKDPNAKWQKPALTTHGRNNHALRSERWRYIRYSDGSEELYDHDKDPMEWTNLADDSRFTDVKKNLVQWFPAQNAPEAKRDNKKKRKNK